MPNENLFWLEKAKRIQALAQAGLTYVQDEFDKERFEELRNISAEMIAQISDEKIEKIPQLFASDRGYPTPKTAVRGLVIRDGKILMVREKLDNHWALPGGWTDIGFSPREVIEKEILEEAGMNVKATRILAILDKKLHPHPPSPWHVYIIFMLCEANETEEPSTGMEKLDVGFFPIDGLPELSIDRNLQFQIEKIFELAQDEQSDVWFD